MVYRVVVFLTVTTMLAACAGTPATQPTAQPTAAPAAANAPAPTNIPSATAVPVPTAAPIAAPSDGCEAGQRLFDHELLASEPVCVPTDPKRIIALDMASVELTLLSDKILLATSNWILSELPLLHPPFAETLTTVEDVGYPANLEKVLALKPDLILAAGGTEVGDAIDIEKAQQIAPLIIADPVIYNDWKLGMQFWSAVLNVPDVYTAMEANYQTRVGELQIALGDRRSREISVIATSSYGAYLWMPDTPPGAILSDVGLARPEAQNLVGDAAIERYEAKQYIPVSLERLDLADADAIFYFTYASNDPEIASQEAASLTAFEQQPVWQSLSAVKAGQAFRVPEYWWRSQTYLLANKVLDDLFVHLTEASATTTVLSAVPELSNVSADSDPDTLQVLESTAAYRLIKHSLGESKVPLQPKRVVTLQDQNALLPLFELGYTTVVGSVGAVKPDGSTYYRRMQNYDTSAVVYVGEYGTPNLEAIAALKPDLILGSQYEVTSENYALLSAIAPTVPIQQFTRPIWGHYTDFALLVDQEAEALALKAKFDARLAEVKAKLNNAADITISLFYIEEPGKLNAEADAQIPYHIVFDGLGLAQKPQVLAARANNQFYIVEKAVSFELLPEFDADVIVVPYFGGEIGEDVKALLASPLWQQLNAVKKDQAYVVNGEQWFGMSYQPMFHILNELEAKLANNSVDTAWVPNP